MTYRTDPSSGDYIVVEPVVKDQTRTLLEAATANELIGAVNKIYNISIEVGAYSGSRLVVSDENIVLQISTKDIRLGEITGSRTGGAAITSLISALGRAFGITDSTSS